jgi:hypothetical protein
MARSVVRVAVGRNLHVPAERVWPSYSIQYHKEGEILLAMSKESDGAVLTKGLQNERRRSLEVQERIDTIEGELRVLRAQSKPPIAIPIQPATFVYRGRRYQAIHWPSRVRIPLPLPKPATRTASSHPISNCKSRIPNMDSLIPSITAPIQPTVRISTSQPTPVASTAPRPPSMHFPSSEPSTVASDTSRVALLASTAITIIPAALSSHFIATHSILHAFGRFLRHSSRVYVRKHARLKSRRRGFGFQ